MHCRQMRLFRPAALLGALGVVVVLAGAANAQDIPVAPSASLAFTNLRLGFAADTAGIYLWASSTEPKGPKPYQALFNPSDLLTWISDARWFLDQKLASTDTGSSRNSPTLTGLEKAGRAYLLRRKKDSEWTTERFLVLEFKDTTQRPFVVSSDEKLLRQILGSMEDVARRAPPFKPSAEDTAKVDEPAKLKPNQRPPAYPPNARMNNQEGVVVVRFVIGVDGMADMSTARVLVSPGDAFHRSVLATLPKLRFEPARTKGQPVRQTVTMPFDFALFRR